MRSNSIMMVLGVGIGGWVLYSVFKNTAQAATGSVGAGLSNPQAARNSAFNYTPSALNASVPGVSFAPSVQDPSVLTSTVTAVPAVTGSQVSQANAFWSTLSPVLPLGSGYITFPSGSQAAAALFGGGTTAMDGAGNLYVQWAGQVYQLGAQDSAGNYPAQVVGGGSNASTSILGVTPYNPDATSPVPSSWLGL